MGLLTYNERPSEWPGIGLLSYNERPNDWPEIGLLTYSERSSEWPGIGMLLYREKGLVNGLKQACYHTMKVTLNPDKRKERYRIK